MNRKYTVIGEPAPRPKPAGIKKHFQILLGLIFILGGIGAGLWLAAAANPIAGGVVLIVGSIAGYVTVATAQ